jgi:hypothetical protein
MTMRNILKIQRQKEEDLIKDAERQQRKAVLMAETGMTFDEPVEEVEEEKDDKKKKGKKVKEVEVDPEELERRRQAQLKAADIAKYGRTWIWEDYLEDTDQVRQLWLDGTNMISKIND